MYLMRFGRLAVVLTFLMNVHAAENYAQWAHYRDITINTSSTGGGANLSGPVGHIPVLVRLTSTDQADVLTQALANGADIRFTKSDGTTRLAHERDRWNATNAEFWVLVDTLSAASSTQTIRMYWGKADAADSSKSAQVFSPGNGFLAVWHFTTLNDATGNGYTLSSTSAPTDASTANAIIGNSKSFDGSSQFYNISDTNNSTPSGATLSLNTNNGPYTVTAWAKPTSCPTGRMMVIGKYDGAGSTGTRQWAMQTKNTAANWGFTNDPNIAAFTSATTGNEYVADAAGACAANTTVYMAGSYSLTGTPVVGATDATGAGGLLFSVNGGAPVASATGAVGTGSQIGTSALPFIGKATGTAPRYMVGTLDEITVSNVQRSQDWIKLSYETQKPGATAVTVGATLNSATIPDAPTAVTGTPGNGQVAVSWTAPASNGGAAITAYTVTASDTSKHCTTTGGTSCTVTGLTNGTAYTFTVKATNSVGTGPASSASAPVTPVAPVGVPAQPTGVTGTPGNAQVTVSWTAPSSDGGSPITGYTVTSNPDGKTCATTGALTCTVTALTNGIPYTFTVTATNSAGTGAASTASAAVTPIGPPGAPTSVTGTSGNAQVAVSWTAPSSNGGSAIILYTATASPGGATCTSTGALTCTVTGLTNGTAYTFTVTATNVNGTGAASSPSSGVTPMGPPGAPTGVTAVAGSGQAAISWTAPASNGGSAIILYTATAAPGGATCTSTGALTCTVTGLAAGSYTFTVTATNAVAGTGAASAASASVTAIQGFTAKNGFGIHRTGSSVVFQIPPTLSGAEISVMDVWGRTVWSRKIAAGSGELMWNGETAVGRSAARGIYLIRLKTDAGGNSKVAAESKVMLLP